MAGFLDKTAQPEQAMQQEQPMTGTNTATEFTPEEQQLYERAFQVGKNVVYDKRMFESLLQDIEGKDPAQALASAMVMVLQAIEKDPSIGQLPVGVALATGGSLLVDVVDVLSEDSSMGFGPEIILDAIKQWIELYLHINGSRINPQEVQAQMQQLQAMGGGE